MKTLFKGNKAQKAYQSTQPYVVMGARLVWALLFGIVLYVLDALNNLRIRAREEPFIVLAALATIIYAVFAYNQWQVMSGQLAEMQAEQRPWIAVKAKIVDDLSIFTTGASTRLEITTKNLGNKPAMNVFPLAQIYPHTTGLINFGVAQEEKCRNWMWPGGFGVTLFPGEDDISGHYVALASEVKIPEHWPTGDGGNFFSGYIVICVNYSPATSAEIHRTAMLYGLYKITESTPAYINVLGSYAN